MHVELRGLYNTSGSPNASPGSTHSWKNSDQNSSSSPDSEENAWNRTFGALFSQAIHRGVTRTRRLGGADFFLDESSLFTRQMSFPLPASRQNLSQQQGTTDLPDKGNIFSQHHPQQPVLKTSRQTPACVISFLSIFSKYYHKVCGTPPHPSW